MQLVIIESLSRVQLFHDPMDCSPPGSSVHFPVKNTGVVAISFSRESSRPKDHASPALASVFFTTGPAGRPQSQLLLPKSRQGSFPQSLSKPQASQVRSNPSQGTGCGEGPPAATGSDLNSEEPVGMNVFSSDKPTDAQRNGGLKSH